MPKKELTPEQAIEEAVEDVRLAMLEKVKADKTLSDATLRKERARFKLQKAKERLNAVEQSFK